MKITKDYLKRLIKEEITRKNLRESLADEFNAAAEQHLGSTSKTNNELNDLADTVIDKMNDGLSAQKAKELLGQITFKADGRGGETSTDAVIKLVSQKDSEKGKMLNQVNTLR